MKEDIFETLETTLQGAAVDPHHHALVLNTFTWNDEEETEDIFESLEPTVGSDVNFMTHCHALVPNTFTWNEDEQVPGKQTA